MSQPASKITGLCVKLVRVGAASRAGTRTGSTKAKTKHAVVETSGWLQQKWWRGAGNFECPTLELLGRTAGLTATLANAYSLAYTHLIHTICLLAFVSKSLGELQSKHVVPLVVDSADQGRAGSEAREDDSVWGLGYRVSRR